MSNINTQLSTIHSNYNERIKTIRQDRNLSVTGRDAALRSAYVSAKTEHNKAQAKHQREQAERKTALENRFFGRLPLGATANDTILFRDANDRAAKLANDAEASQAMRTAVQTRDTTLQQAILRRAYNIGATNTVFGEPHVWIDAINAYEDGNKHAAAELQEFVDITAPSATNPSSFVNAMQGTGPMKPEELGNVSDFGLGIQ